LLTILDVFEAPEPDNILYANVEMDNHTKVARKAMSFSLTLLLLAALYLVIDQASAANPLLGACVIAAADSMLPIAFTEFTNWAR
jgi:Na+-translocating ferredoxin:NAD+ oxidoreductase RnfA subunit